jgi:alkanesulfonate monooxygenase SsuD/methylene tetrahydromethanopterin reductase-like flavin-dependent oxidoreductase (luciferase family)
MVMLALRFDLRNPAFAGVSSGDRIRAAVDMAEWADTRGGVAVSISEHHSSDDGYMPSPLIFAAAAAARTRNSAISIGALLTPFYDPIRLAEDLAVLDNLSGGRINLILGGAYVATEFELYGVPSNERGARVEKAVDTLRKAWTGQPFEYEGRTVQVTPAPDRPGGPPLIIGGSSNAAARRAARIGDGYAPTGPESWEAYRAEMTKLGKPDPGPSQLGPVVTTYIDENPEDAWEELAPYFLHETNSYGEWLAGAGADGPYKVTTAQDLRSTGQYRIITPDECQAELDAMGEAAMLMLHPMVGGIPPERAWRMLELVERTLL